MPIMAIVEFPPSDLDMRAEYERVGEEINGHPFTSLADWGGGLISHAAAPTPEGGGIVVDVWEDQASMDAWMAKVMPLTQDGPEAQVRVLETLNVVTGAPVRA
jgi:hypothetical protein